MDEDIDEVKNNLLRRILDGCDLHVHPFADLPSFVDLEHSSFNISIEELDALLSIGIKIIRAPGGDYLDAGLDDE